MHLIYNTTFNFKDMKAPSHSTCLSSYLSHTVVGFHFEKNNHGGSGFTDQSKSALFCTRKVLSLHAGTFKKYLLCPLMFEIECIPCLFRLLQWRE